MHMDETLYWRLFLQTGSPEAYLLYRNENKRTEAKE